MTNGKPVSIIMIEDEIAEFGEDALASGKFLLTGHSRSTLFKPFCLLK